MRRSRKGTPLARLLAAVSLGAAGLLACVSPASASNTIGQLAPTTPADANCIGQSDFVPEVVGSGNTYTVPEAGTITSWTTNAATGGGQQLTLKVFRKIDATHYQVVGHAGPQGLTPSGTAGNTFAASIPVKAGDLVGDNSENAAAHNNACDFVAASSFVGINPPGNLADGDSGPFSNFANHLPNVTAVLDPTSSFSLGPPTRNKKRGTALVTASVPNPGELTVSGNGVAAGASAATAVAGPGQVQLTIAASGKKRKTLKRKGKVALSPTITFTATGGNPSSQSLPLKLTKKLKKTR